MPENNQVTNETEENIFDMHRNARKRKRRKLIIIVIIIAVAVGAAIIVGINVLQKNINSQFTSTETEEVQEAEVTTGSITATVTGSGTLADKDVYDVEILNDLEIEDYLVEAGDEVKKGDLIVTVTETSLLNMMSDLQEEISDYDEEIEEAADEEVDSEITAGVSGRVKRIYVSEGDEIIDAMYQNGSLMDISVDGYLAVDLATSDLSEDDEVVVYREDGTAIDGTVGNVSEGTAVILIADDSAGVDEAVTVKTTDDTKIGEGTLYIHSPLAVTGYAGTVSSVDVSENEYVDAGDTLIELTDTGTTAYYDALVSAREKVEEKLEEVVDIYQKGGITSPTKGVISSITTVSTGSTESLLQSAASGMSGSVQQSSSSSSSSSSSTDDDHTVFATISPEKEMTVTVSVDESDILSIEEGQSATVTVPSLDDAEYEGEVYEVGREGTNTSGVSLYDVTVVIDKEENMLNGMSASVAISIDGSENALLLPEEAVTQTSTKSFVYTEYNEETGELSGITEVETGLNNGSYIEITSGLKEGDKVYYQEKTEETDMFGDFPNMGGGMNGGQMPDMGGGGNMTPPDMGGTPGGNNAGGMK